MDFQNGADLLRVRLNSLVNLMNIPGLIGNELWFHSRNDEKIAFGNSVLVIYDCKALTKGIGT